MDSSLVALILGEMAFLAFLVWLGAQVLRERSRRRSELQLRLVDRFGSSGEFLAFLDTEDGRRFRDALTGRRFHLIRQVLAGLQLGIVLLCLGAGLFVAARAQADRDLQTAAAVFAGVGIGLLLAATVSRALAVRWGVWSESTPER